MNTKNFGVYLYGSRARGESNQISDVDLIVMTNEKWTDAQAEEMLAPSLREQFPEWREKKFDCAIVPCSKTRPAVPYQVTNLALLHQTGSQVIFGSHLLPQSYSPSWDEYFQAEKQLVQYWMRITCGANAKYFFDKSIKDNRTRFLYGFCFTVAIYQKLLSNPKAWIFHASQIQNPLLDEIDQLVRVKWQYKPPSDEGDLHKLKFLCAALSLEGMKLNSLK